MGADYNQAPDRWELQNPAYLAQAAAVQNTWYTVLNTILPGKILNIWELMGTLAETIEMRITIDGTVYNGARAAVAGTNYFTYIRGGLGGYEIFFDGVTIGAYQHLEYETLHVEIRKTTANGANPLYGACIYMNRV